MARGFAGDVITSCMNALHHDPGLCIAQEGNTKRASFLTASLLSSPLSCGRGSVFTEASTCGGKILVAEDREDTVERTVDCGITRDYDHLSVRELLAEGKVFLVETGTNVMMRDGFTLSRARRIQVLEGTYTGKTGWVYERAVSPDRSGLSSRLVGKEESCGL